jgi:predicted nuclease of predicted toxin-antitoxin system
MRIIANENIMATVIRELRNRGHDVLWVKESTPGATDEAVLSLAQSEQRVVLTHDKDFGELAFRFGLLADCGVLLARLSGGSPQTDAGQLIAVLESRDDWQGHFSVISQGRLRMRPLPAQRKPK